MKIGYLHLGTQQSGIRRYGRLLANEARRRGGLTVIEADVTLRETARENHDLLAKAAETLSEADVIHCQYNKRIWGDGWSHLHNLQAFLDHCRRPVVVTMHDVYVDDFSLPRFLASLPGKFRRRLSASSSSPSGRSAATVGPARGGDGTSTTKSGWDLLRRGGRVLVGVTANALSIHLLSGHVRLMIVCTDEEATRVARLLGGAKSLSTKPCGTGFQAGRSISKPVIGIGSKHRVVPHFVEERSIAITPEEARRALGLTGERIVTLLGFIVPRKGYRLLLDAQAGLPDDVTLVFAGGAPVGGEQYIEELKHVIESRGLGNRVRITGYVPEEELERYLVASDLAVCPFRDLSASGSLSTWISVAKPLLAYHLPQIAEYNRLEPGAIKTFTPYTSDALAQAICRLLPTCGGGEDPILARLRKRLSISSVFDEYLRHYCHAAGAPVGPSTGGHADQHRVGTMADWKKNACRTRSGHRTFGRDGERALRRPLRATFLPQWYRNPYQKMLDDHLSALGVRMERFDRDLLSILKGLIRNKPDVLHLHWLQPFYEAPNTLVSLIKLAASITGILVLKALGTRIVWTVHNLKNHENRNPRLDHIWTAFVIGQAHAVLAHCETASRQVVAEFGVRSKNKIHVIPHGHYMDWYDSGADRAESRRSLGVPETGTVLLFLGNVRPYKGVLDLVDAFRQVRSDEAHLVIAGKPLTDESANMVTERIAGCANIKFIPGFIPDDQIQVYMNASDAVVLPYRDILTSGAAVLAMSFGRACIAPRLGCINDILDEHGAFLYDPDASDGLLRALKSAVASGRDLARMGAHNRRLAEQWDWERIAQRTLDAYR